MRYFTFWLARDLGRAVASLLLRSLTIVLAYALVFDITLPHGGGDWLAFGVALTLSMLASFSWRFLINLAAFWTPDAQGVGRLAFSLSWLLSGFLMPLRLFPDSLPDTFAKFLLHRDSRRIHRDAQRFFEGICQYEAALLSNYSNFDISVYLCAFSALSV